MSIRHDVIIFLSLKYRFQPFGINISFFTAYMNLLKKNLKVVFCNSLSEIIASLCSPTEDLISTLLAPFLFSSR